MFARFFSILGIDSEADEYSGLFLFGRYFLGVYENSLGNISTPGYTIWDPSKKDNKNLFNSIILVVIWVIWFLNQWFIFMILLNFIIALISQSYDDVMEKQMETEYLQKTKLNRECRFMMKTLGSPCHP